MEKTSLRPAIRAEKFMEISPGDVFKPDSRPTGATDATEIRAKRAGENAGSEAAPARRNIVNVLQRLASMIPSGLLEPAWFLTNEARATGHHGYRRSVSDGARFSVERETCCTHRRRQRCRAGDRRPPGRPPRLRMPLRPLPAARPSPPVLSRLPGPPPCFPPPPLSTHPS